MPRPAAHLRRRVWGAVALIAATIALLLTLRPWESGAGEPGADPDPKLVETGDESAPATPAAQTTRAPEPVPAPAPQAPVRWRAVGDVGAVRVDGVEVAGAEALERALAGARTSAVTPADTRTIEVVSGTLRLCRGDVLLLEATETTEFAWDARSAAPDLAFALERGVLRVCTGPAFSGSKLELRTPDVELGVVGTAFAVDLYEQGTCVCCSHGSVAVAPLDLDASHAVGAGAMLFAYRDRAVPCASGGVLDEHAGPLRALEQLAATLW